MKALLVRGYPSEAVNSLLIVRFTSDEEIDAGGGKFYFFASAVGTHHDQRFNERCNRRAIFRFAFAHANAVFDSGG
jgi:hypothetical protein